MSFYEFRTNSDLKRKSLYEGGLWLLCKVKSK